MAATDSYPGTGSGQTDAGFVSPYLVVGIQCLRPTAPSRRLSLLDVDAVEVGRGDVRADERDDDARELRVRVADRWMSTKHARIERDGDHWTLRDIGSKNGTFVAGAPVTRVKLRDGDVVEVGSTFFLFRDSVVRLPGEPGTLDAAEQAEPLALKTLHPGLWRAFRQLARIARGDAPVFVTGETGTGKELIARAIHHLSRRAGPFSPINCAAIAESLVDSELFGHRKGAFSGAAHEHAGLIRAAHRGTLFLDEVAELAEPSQAKLLRALQEGEVVPVGETRRVPVDARVVAATHQDLGERIADGRFRQDLYARLAGFRIELPPLRERREDLALFVAHAIAQRDGDASTFTRRAVRALYDYDWPSNIRELQFAIDTALQLADGAEVKLEHLPEVVRRATPMDERSRLVTLLRTHGGNVTRVAEEMATSPGHVRRLAKRHGVDVATFRS